MKWVKKSIKLGKEKTKGVKLYEYISDNPSMPKLRYESNASHPYSFEGGWGEFDTLKEAKDFAETEILDYVNEMEQAEKEIASRGAGGTKTKNT